MWFVPSTRIFLAEAVYMVLESSYLSARNSKILAHVNQKALGCLPSRILLPLACKQPLVTVVINCFRFEAVKFSNNHARASSAIRFTTAQPYGSNVDLSAEFINCSFTYHKMSIFARTSPFTSQRINLMFKGNNIFQQNSGGKMINRR